jgi:hypothetical protein
MVSEIFIPQTLQIHLMRYTGAMPDLWSKDIPEKSTKAANPARRLYELGMTHV